MIRSQQHRDASSLRLSIPRLEVGKSFDAKCDMFTILSLDQLHHMIFLGTVTGEENHLARDRRARTSNDLEPKQVGIEGRSCFRIFDLYRDVSESRPCGHVMASS